MLLNYYTGVISKYNLKYKSDAHEESLAYYNQHDTMLRLLMFLMSVLKHPD